MSQGQADVDEVIMGDRNGFHVSGDRVKPQVPANELELDQIRTAVSGIRYGEVRVIIQDGYVVQIERLEKQRFR